MTIIPIKSLKVTLVLDPATLPQIDTTGMRELLLHFAIPGTPVKLSAKLNPKTYRKALKTIEEHQNNVALILQGKINSQWHQLEEAGLVAQPKVPKPATAKAVEAAE
jgi:hypothetical protein